MIAQNGQAVKYINAIGLKGATGITKKINEQITRDFGLAGPLTLSTPSKRVHAVRWVTARECFIVETHVKRVLKEIVATSVAQINKCPYCEDAHSTSIMSTGNKSISEIITNGDWQTIEDDKIKQLISWSLNTRNPNALIIKNPPFSKEEAPEIIGTAMTFHSTNRLVNIFLEESPLPSFLGNGFIKRMALNFASKTLFKSMVEKQTVIGDGLQFINNYPIAVQFNWATEIPSFAKALTAENVLLTEIEEELISIEIVELFIEKVNNWQGEEMPLGRNWLTKIIQNINEKDKPIANLVFLAAFAPYSIAKNDIDEFRNIYKSDTALVEVCFWAIQKTTNRIGEWMIKPFQN